MEQDKYLLSLVLFSIMLEVLASAMRQEEEIKQSVKAEIKLPVFAVDLVVKVEHVHKVLRTHK